MKVRFLKPHQHQGQQYQPGDVADLPVHAVSKLLWRKLAENAEAPADPEPETVEVEAVEPSPMETASLEPPEETAVKRTFLPGRRRIKVDE